MLEKNTCMGCGSDTRERNTYIVQAFWNINSISKLYLNIKQQKVYSETPFPDTPLTN